MREDATARAHHHDGTGARTKHAREATGSRTPAPRRRGCCGPPPLQRSCGRTGGQAGAADGCTRCRARRGARGQRPQDQTNHTRPNAGAAADFSPPLPSTTTAVPAQPTVRSGPAHRPGRPAFHRRCHGGGDATAGGFALLTHTVRHTRPLRGRRRKEFSLQGARRGGVRRDTGKDRHWYGSGDRRGGRSTPPRWRDGVATIPPFPPALLRRPTPRIPAPPARPIPPSPSASQQPCQTPAAADTACSRESGARRSQRRWDGTARGVWACGEVALPMAHALGNKVDGSTGGARRRAALPVGGGVRVGRSLRAA